MKIDPLLSLALALDAHKGIYALLLGSGVSRAAGIPTGWEVVLDLIERIAAAEGQDTARDPEKWFTEKYESQPNYSEIVERLAPKPAERTSLLKTYFEPSEEEREDGLKLPSEAHKCIARLVMAGHINVIITTNFDRLLEEALSAEGIKPFVVSSPDQIEGMMPLQHLDCLVFKIHGDYLDTRIRNTSGELEVYDDPTNNLLEQILTEYGLIVCGWSAGYDEALCNAILRTTKHRFSTFWMQHGELSEKAEAIVAHRKAQVLNIQTADAAFAQLEEKLSALETGREPHPLSPKIAVFTMKKYLADEKFRIRLHDYVSDETQRVRNSVGSESFPVSEPEVNKESYRERIERYDAICSNLVPMVSTGVYWGGDELTGLWKDSIESLARVEIPDGTVKPAWSHLKYFPAALIMYGMGIVAVDNGRWKFLKILLEKTEAVSKYKRELLCPLAASEYCFFSSAAQTQFEGERRETPGSDIMATRIKPLISHAIDIETRFDAAFDYFELLLALVGHAKANSIPMGRFTWRTRYGETDRYLLDAFKRDLDKREYSHPLLQAGFFGGELDALAKSVKAVS